MPRLMEKKDWMQTVADVGSAERPCQMKSARDYIGYCRGNYNGHTTTAEIMKELREGEE